VNEYKRMEIWHLLKTAPLGLFAFGLAAWVQAESDKAPPAGLWKTIDDMTGKPRSLVRIVKINGALEGKVEKIFFRPNERERNPLCTECEGKRHNQPIIGMTILWGLKKQSDSYDGGQILDPENGNVYRCKIELRDQGAKLKVHGFMGISLLGRTQIWLREE
jgi:uncharacterized protein (DUF2147 family)